MARIDPRAPAAHRIVNPTSPRFERSDSTLPSALPLEGMLVVAVEQAVAAPFASRQLADLGARVIKIERPGSGDFARGYDRTVKGLASHFVWINRTKESLTLDLKRPEAADVLRRLLSRADVLLHNLAPGAMARLGFASSALHEQHPRLVVCEISGYGTDGPYRDKKAYDLLVQSEAGLRVDHRHAGRALEGRRLDRRHRRRDVCLLGGPGRAAAPRAHRHGRGARHLDVRRAGRVDGISGVLHRLRRHAAAANRRGARGHRAVRAVHGWRRQSRLPRSAERARVGEVLRRGAGAAVAGHRSPIQRERRARRAPRGARCAHHRRVRDALGRRSRWRVSTPRRSPTRA